MSDSGAELKGFTGPNMSDSGAGPKGFTGRNMSDSEAGPKGFTGRNMSDSGAGLNGFTGPNMSDTGAGRKGFIGPNMSDSGAGRKGFTGPNMSDSGAGPKGFTGSNICDSGAGPIGLTGPNMSDSGAAPKGFIGRNMSDSGARPKGFAGTTMSDSGAGPKGFTGRNMSDSGAEPKYFTRSKVSNNEVRLKDFIDRNMSYSGAKQKNFTGRNMRDSGAGSKDLTNRKMSDSRARSKYFTDINMSDSGAGPKDFTDISMSYSGARPKEKSSSRLKQNLESQSKDDSNEFNRHISVRLDDVLDRVGASADFRKLYQNSSLLREIITTIHYQLVPRAAFTANYIFGSSSEGTQIPSFNSDIDSLVCPNYPAIEDICEAGDRGSLLMIRDKHTQPGYVKLQCVYNGGPLTDYTRDKYRYEYDCEGRICLQHLSCYNACKNNNTRNGPADTDNEENVDHVVGFKCSTIPKFSREWIGRNRQYKWPSKRMVDTMVRMGCFVVGVGHPMSIEQNIEWRLSFSLQEREMMFSMSMTHHKCYVTLKLIKKDLIEPVVGKSISSYHLKTCMFYAIENTRLSFWKKGNLSQCVCLCICILFKWVYIGYCPNYFIQEENMFDRDIHRRQRLRLLHQIRFLLSHGFGLLFLIKIDNVGLALKYNKRILHMELPLTRALFKARYRSIESVMECRNELCRQANVHDNARNYLKISLNFVSQTKSVNNHTKQQSHEAFSLLIPYIHLNLAQSYASLAFNTYTADGICELLQEYSYHLRKGSNCDLTSPILLEATVLLKLEQNERCVGILDQLQLEFNRVSLSMCGCYCGKSSFSKERRRQLNNLSDSDIIGRTSTCMIFIRSDMSITPEALRYEMFRSIHTQQVYPDLREDTWFYMAVVDAVVYLHFLQYLANAKLNRLIHKHMAIYKLESVLKRDYNLAHRETGYNLLGWIHLQENWIPRAIKYFKKSWAIRPHLNAAKLHMLILIRDINS